MNVSRSWKLSVECSDFVWTLSHGLISKFCTYVSAWTLEKWEESYQHLDPWPRQTLTLNDCPSSYLLTVTNSGQPRRCTGVLFSVSCWYFWLPVPAWNLSCSTSYFGKSSFLPIQSFHFLPFGGLFISPILVFQELCLSSYSVHIVCLDDVCSQDLRTK